MNKFFYFIAMLLVGCGTVEKETVVEVKRLPVAQPFYIDKKKVSTKLLPHVMEFAGYCETFGLSERCLQNFEKMIEIKTVNSFPEKYVVGKCFIGYPNGARWIEILDSWTNINSFSAKTVVIHELAHCVLGSGTTGVFPHYDNDEEDIMNPYLLSEKSIFASWPKLLQKMFLRAGGKLYLTEETEISIVTQTLVNELGEVSCDEATTN